MPPRGRQSLLIGGIVNTILLGLLVIVAPAVLSGLCVLASRRFLHKEVREGHNDVLVPIFLTAGTIYAVMLGFLVVVVWEAYGDAKENLTAEAATLTTMYRMTYAMAPPERKAMREHLRGYTEAVIHKEWTIQAKTGGAAVEARDQIANLYKAFLGLPHDEAVLPINYEFLAQFSLMASARDKRRLQSSEEFPWLLWFGLIGGAAITISMSCMLYMDKGWPHIVMSGVLCVMIGMLLFITVVLSKPFKGPLALQPEAFEHANVVFDAVDAGH